MTVTKYIIEGGNDEPESTNSQPALVLVLHCVEHCSRYTLGRWHHMVFLF